MCSYKTLHHSENGYVVLCQGCQHLQVAFGTTAISLTEDQFFAYRDSIACYFNKYKHCGDHRNQKIVQIPTKVASMVLLYSLAELENLSDLLEQAAIGLEIEKLFTQE